MLTDEAEASATQATIASPAIFSKRLFDQCRRVRCHRTGKWYPSGHVNDQDQSCPAEHDHATWWVSSENVLRFQQLGSDTGALSSKVSQPRHGGPVVDLDGQVDLPHRPLHGNESLDQH